VDREDVLEAREPARCRAVLWFSVYRGTSLVRNSAPLGPYSKNEPRALWWSQGRRLLLRREVSL